MPAFICSICNRSSARSRAIDCNSCVCSGDGLAAVEPTLSAAACASVEGAAVAVVSATAAGAGCGSTAGLSIRDNKVRTKGGAHLATSGLTISPWDSQTTAAPARHAVKIIPITTRINRRPNDVRAPLPLTLLVEAARKVASTGGTAVPAAAVAPTSGAEAVTSGAEAATFGAEAMTFGADAVTFGAGAVTFGVDAATIGAEAVTFGGDAVTIGAEAATFGAEAVTFGAEEAGSFGGDGVGLPAAPDFETSRSAGESTTSGASVGISFGSICVGVGVELIGALSFKSTITRARGELYRR